MKKQPPKCHWDGEHWLSPEHAHDCTDASCKGCRPCPEDHCAMRGSCPEHVQHAAGIITCPRCIGRVRSNLAKIVDHYAVELPVEAEFAGVNSEAMALVGPAAAPEQLAARRQYRDRVEISQGWCVWPRVDLTDDPHHPYYVLGRWDLALREQYGPQTDLFITVTSAAEYLRKLLDGPFPHDGREFEEFAAEISKCLSHMEEVAHNSRRPEQGRPCPRCSEAGVEHPPRLLKRFAAHPGTRRGDRCTEADRQDEKRGWCSWPRDDHEVDCDVCDGALDTWHCPEVGEHWWSEEDYRQRVATDYVTHADELPARELAERLGVPASTVRSWISPTRHVTLAQGVFTTPPKLRPAGRINGRRTYSVEEAARLKGRSSA